MKKKILLLILPVLLVAGLIGGICFRKQRQEAREAAWQAEMYAVPHLSMTLTEKYIAELERYTALQTVDFRDSTCYGLILDYARSHPEVAVTYNVDLGGTWIKNDVTEAELPAQGTDFDTLMENLQYLPQLQRLHLPRTELKAEQLSVLRDTYPDVEISWTVEIMLQEYTWDTDSLMLKNADAGELEAKLGYLPMLQDVTFADTAPAGEKILQLKSAYPGVCFHWDFLLFGIPVSSDSTEIDLSGIVMDSVTELEAALPYFNCLEKVVMCDTGLASEEIDALWKRHPEIRFVWNVKIGKFRVRTDIIALMPYQYGYDGLQGVKLYDEDCTEMKYLVDMVCLDFGHMGITDCSFVNYMPNLKYLILADTGVTDLTPIGNLKNLVYLEAFFSKVEDISPLAGCTALEDVNICHNRIEDFSALLELDNLKHIWIAGNRISAEQRQLLEEKFPDARIIYNLEGSTGAGWREIPNYYAQRDLLGMYYLTG